MITILTMLLFQILAQTTTMPSGWEEWTVRGVLVFILTICGGVIVHLYRELRALEKDKQENYIPKGVYDDMKSRCEQEDEKCNKCMYVNGDTLRKLYEILGEIDATGQLNVQALAAIRQTLDNALLRGGN